MDNLLQQGGFASVAAQWINCVLLLALFLLITRHVDDRRAYGFWLGARISMLVAVTSIIAWFYVLPTMLPDLFAHVSGGTSAALALYVASKGAYWLFLAFGILHVQRHAPSDRTRAVALGGFALTGVIVMAIWPKIDTAILLQSALAVPITLLAIRELGSSDGGSGTLGRPVMRLVLGVHAVVWLAYGAAQLGPKLGMFSVSLRPLALFWLANAYVDALLDALLTFSMLVILIEDSYARIDRERQDRHRRVRAQQSRVVALARMPEIPAGEFDTLARTATRFAAEGLEVERASVWMFSDDRAELKCHVLYSWGSETYSSGTELLACDLPIYFSALEGSRYIDASEAQTDPRTSEFRGGYLEENGVVSMLDVEIRGTTESVGVICLEHAGVPRVWHDDEVAFAGFIADQLAQTLANRRAIDAEGKRDELERQLRHSQKLEAIGQLAGGIAHDFNNMLCAIMGYASLAEMKATQDVQVSLEHIMAASGRAEELTRKLLSFSRRQVLKREIVEVNELVESTAELLRRVAPGSVQIVVDLDEEAGRAVVDRSELEQVLLNLCNNACDAMPDGGRLTVRTRSKPGSSTDGDSDHAETWTAIEVSDTGTGIPEESLDRIFEPFFTTKPPGEGTGLGLATSYGIVEQHGGQLRVQSEVQAGTTFEIVLPVVDQPVTERVLGTSGAAAGGNETLLVVEDDPTVRSLMESILVSAGYQVLLAEDGAVAIDRFGGHADEIDAVMLDSVLPRVSGREVLEMIRSNSSDTPVVCTSGYLSTGSTDGFDAVLPKPFTRDGLLAAVRSVLDDPGVE